MRLIVFAVYLGIGAILHAAVVGSTFDWSSAWTFAWLFAWPIMLIITFGVVIAGAIVVIALAYTGWSWLKEIAGWKERRR